MCGIMKIEEDKEFLSEKREAVRRGKMCGVYKVLTKKEIVVFEKVQKIKKKRKKKKADWPERKLLTWLHHVQRVRMSNE